MMCTVKSMTYITMFVAKITTPEIAISWWFQAVSAGDCDPTMDYLNHTCGVGIRDVSDLSECVRLQRAQNAISVLVRVLRNLFVSKYGNIS